jgi:hypothetical protein
VRRTCIRDPIGDQHLATPGWHRIDTPAMRDAMQALQAALEEAGRHLALYAFRRRSALRLRAARLYRLGADRLGELPAADRERFIRDMSAHVAAPAQDLGVPRVVVRDR